MILDVQFDQIRAELDVRFDQIRTELDVDFGEITKVIETDVPHYLGAYVVTPGVDPVELETRNKIMDEDVHVKSIPYYDVGNTAGGSTVYIGKELE